MDESLEKVGSQRTKRSIEGTSRAVKNIGDESSKASKKVKLSSEEMERSLKKALRGASTEAERLNITLDYATRTRKLDLDSASLKLVNLLARDTNRQLDKMQRKKVTSVMESLGLAAAEGGEGGIGLLKTMAAGAGAAAGRFALMGAVILTVLPAVVALGAAVTALTASLTAAVGGAGVLGLGMIGAFGVGLGTIAAVAIPAIKGISEMTKAQDALNKAMATGDPAAIQKAQQAIDDLEKKMPGVSKVYDQIRKLKDEFTKGFAGGRRNFFGIVTDGIQTLRNLIPLLAKEAKRNMGALRGAMAILFAGFRSKGFAEFIQVMGSTFRASVRPLARTFVAIGRGLANIAEAAKPHIIKFFEGLAHATERWAKGMSDKHAVNVVNDMIGHLKVWWNLMKSIVNLVGAIFGPAKGPGKGLAVSLTDTFNNWAKDLRSDPKGVTKFFEKWAKAARQLGHAFENVVVMLMRLADALKPVTDAVVFILRHLPKDLLVALTASGAVLGAKKGHDFVKDALGKGRGMTIANPLYVQEVTGGLGGDKPGGKGKSTTQKVKDFVKDPRTALSGTGAAAVLRGAAPYAAGAAKLSAFGSTAYGLAYLATHVNKNLPTGGGAALRRQARKSGMNGDLPSSQFEHAPESGTRPLTMLDKIAPGIEGIRGIAKSTKALDDLRDKTDKTRKSVVDDTDAIRDKGKKHFEAWREAIDSNVSRVQRSVNTGLGRIVADFNKAMRTVNAPAGAVSGVGAGVGDAVSNVGTAVAGGATGMRIKGAGKRDSVMVAPGHMAAPGELIVNRHTESKIDRMLSLYGTNMGAMVSGEQRPHYMATGGRVAGLQPGISNLASSVIGHFPGLSITSTTGGQHAAGSYHYKGQAVDIGGSPALMNQAAAWIARKFGRSLAEGIHNPNLSIKGGSAVSPSFWGGTVWGMHANHIHLAVAGALEALGLGGMMRAPHLRRRHAAGHGMARAIGQRALDRVRRRGNKTLKGAFGAAGGGLNGIAGISGGGTNSENMALAHRMMLAAGFGPDQWGPLHALWMRESGFSTTAANPSGAYGIPQSLPGSKMASAGADWRTNPATQIRWGLNYIKGRYGTPAGAWAHSQATNWYDKGGRMPEWGGWYGRGGDFTAHRPTLIGVGERGAERVQVTPAGGGGTRPVMVRIGKIENHRPGDIRRAIREEVGQAIGDLGREFEVGVEEEVL